MTLIQALGKTKINKKETKKNATKEYSKIHKL